MNYTFIFIIASFTYLGCNPNKDSKPTQIINNKTNTNNTTSNYTNPTKFSSDNNSNSYKYENRTKSSE